jgi:hypothetical protein
MPTQFLLRTMGPVYMDHYPAGSSTKSFVHFAQIFNEPGSFAKFDYGVEKVDFMFFDLDKD